MIRRRYLAVAVLAGICVLAVLFAAVPIRSLPPVGDYSPWIDVNDDGKIDGKDLGDLAGIFGSSGQNLTKASLQHDSGWIDISDKAGQYFDVVHNLNSADVMVDITGKTTADGAVHQRNIGGTDFVAGWNKTYGGTALDFAFSVIQTSDGGYAWTGYTRSFGAGMTDFWLVKIDSAGNMQWNKTYGGPYREEACSLIQTSDGGYAMVGNKDVSGGENFDVWIVKTDSFGNMQWNKTYGGNAYDFSAGKKSVVQTNDGGYTIAGRTRSFAVGQEDMWLIRIDSAGNLLWSKVYGGTNYDGSGSMVPTMDGGYALAGWTQSYGAGSADMWLVKTNSTGDMQWSHTYGGTGDEDAYNLIQTADLGYALVGQTTSFGAGAQDLYFVKTDSSGNMQWNKTYGGTADEWGHGVIQTSNGQYVIVGTTFSFGAGSGDVWLIWTDVLGNVLQDKLYGGTAGENCWCLIQSDDGGYVIAGMTQSLGAGDWDSWLIKADAAGNALDGFKYGLAWVDSTANSITLYRGTDDAYWNYVRVRVWKVKDSP
jgi:hypothetical protein